MLDDRTELEVADVPVDAPEMRDTRWRYIHTIAGGPRDAQPLGAFLPPCSALP